MTDNSTPSCPSCGWRYERSPVANVRGLPKTCPVCKKPVQNREG